MIEITLIQNYIRKKGSKKKTNIKQDKQEAKITYLHIIMTSYQIFMNQLIFAVKASFYTCQRISIKQISSLITMKQSQKLVTI